VKKTTGLYPRPSIDTKAGAAVGQAGGVLLTGTVRVAGLDTALRGELARWRSPWAVHDPAKVLLDLALTLALGGDTCSDLAVVRAEPALFGQVASDPTTSRTIAALARDVERVLPAVDRARAIARRHRFPRRATGGRSDRGRQAGARHEHRRRWSQPRRCVQRGRSAGCGRGTAGRRENGPVPARPRSLRRRHAAPAATSLAPIDFESTMTTPAALAA
jgi:hypothetical protein